MDNNTPPSWVLHLNGVWRKHNILIQKRDFELRNFQDTRKDILGQESF